MNLSGKLDSLSVELLRTIVEVTARLDIAFFVAGATARDVILYHGYGIQPTRATVDIDVGVMVESWQHYHALYDGLIETSRYQAQNDNPHRLIYREQMPVDLMPFGNIQGGAPTVLWPPDHEVEMNVLGFSDVYEAVIVVRLDRKLEVQFASLPGLALMKLLAWHDRGMGHNRDAQDLALLVRTYADAGNIDRLFEHHGEMLEAEEFDVPVAGARLLGIDIAAIAGSEVKAAIVDILNTETDRQGNQRLATAMTGGGHAFATHFEENVKLLERLRLGLLEGSS